MVGVQIAEDRPDLVAEDVAQRQRNGVDHGHVGAVGAGRGGHLAADPAGADDHHPGTVGQLLPQGQGVVEGAQHVHAGAVEARQGARAGAGGQQQAVVSVFHSVGVDDHVVGRAQGGDGGVAAQCDAVLAVVARFPDPVRFVPLAEQDALGERGQFVGVVAFLPEQGDVSVEPLFTQGCRGRRAGQSGADDQDPPGRVLRCGHDCLRDSVRVRGRCPATAGRR